MQRWRVILVGAALLVIAWVVFSTLPVQGTWQARLQRGDDTSSFAFRVHASRSGINGWLRGNAGSRALEGFDASRNRLQFDLPLDGHRYRLDGRARNRHIEGTWRDENGASGSWQADRVQRR